MLTAQQIVLLLSALLTSLMGLLLVVQSRNHAGNFKGLSEWGSGILFPSVVIFFLNLFGSQILTEVFRSVLQQVFAITGAMLCGYGLRRFVNEHAQFPFRLVAGFWLLFVTCTTWFAFVQPSPVVTYWIFIFSVIALLLDMTLVCLHNRHLGYGIKILSAVFLAMIVACSTVLLTVNSAHHWPLIATQEEDSFVLFLLFVVLVPFSTLVFLSMGSEALAQRIEQFKRYDDQTSVLNKRAFYQELRKEIERSIRYKHNLSIMMLDLDNFKVINDTLGHTQADNMLKQIAAKVESSVRSTDLVARIDGDEFVVLLSETGLEDAENVAQRILVNVQEILPEGLNSNIGLSSLRSPGDTVDSLLHRASQAVKKARLEGKNSFAVA